MHNLDIKKVCHRLPPLPSSLVVARGKEEGEKKLRLASALPNLATVRKSCEIFGTFGNTNYAVYVGFFYSDLQLFLFFDKSTWQLCLELPFLMEDKMRRVGVSFSP